MVIRRDSGLSTLCHSYRFACQQRVLKMFPGNGCFSSEDGIILLGHFLVIVHIYGSLFYRATYQSSTLWALGVIVVCAFLCKAVW